MRGLRSVSLGRRSTIWPNKIGAEKGKGGRLLLLLSSSCEPDCLRSSPRRPRDIRSTWRVKAHNRSAEIAGSRPDSGLVLYSSSFVKALLSTARSFPRNGSESGLHRFHPQYASKQRYCQCIGSPYSSLFVQTATGYSQDCAIFSCPVSPSIQKVRVMPQNRYTPGIRNRRCHNQHRGKMDPSERLRRAVPSLGAFAASDLDGRLLPCAIFPFHRQRSWAPCSGCDRI
jgi:hypothetical protein